MAKLEILVLGPVQVWASGRRLPLAGSITESLLATLAVDADRAVTLDALVDTGWEADPPRTVRRQIRNRLAQLRRTLVEAGFPAGVVDTDAGGYVLRTQGIRLDLGEFRRLAKRGAQASGGAAAVATLREALALWRGPAFAGLESPRLLAVADQLAEQRLMLWERCLGLELRAGQHERVIAELVGLHRMHPAREPLARLLMLALYRSGRQADALEVFHTTRRHLADDLGLRPGAQLRTLHEDILRESPKLALPSDTFTVPQELPRESAHFTGRAEALARLDGWLDALDERAGGSVVISAIAGMGGVGKTALAVHWAYRVRERFPDGVLYIDLRGFDPAGTAVTAAEAIRRFLDSLGVPVQRIPADAQAQCNLYRTLLAHKRMLVVLDNARDPDQVRPLLPGAPGSLVLITSRNRMASLVAAEGAHALPLDLLTHDEARGLLTVRFGQRRVAAEPGAVDDIIALCGRLPLALSIVCAHAVGDPQRPLRTLAEHLRDSRVRLDALSTGDTVSTDVRAVFSWSYRTLGEAAAVLFRLLGLCPGPGISLAAAASAAGMPIDRVRPLLHELTAANLLTEPAPGRYAFHDLLRAYAADLAYGTDPAEDRRAAVHRFLDHYLHTAIGAIRVLSPHRTPDPPAAAVPGVVPEELRDIEQAFEWFATERAVLLAAIERAAADGFDTHAWRLAGTLWTFLDRRGHWQDLVTTQLAAMAVAQRLADPALQAQAHRNLGRAHTRLGRFDDALGHLRQALELSGSIGDRAGQADTHLRLANVWERQARHAEALRHSEQALELSRAAGDRLGQALALNAIGWYHALLGDHRRALDPCRQAVDLLAELDNRPGQGAAWDSLGYAHHHLGHHGEAIACHQHPVELYRGLGDRFHEARSLTHLGDTHHATGDPDAARARWQHALAILEELDHPHAENVRAKLAGRAG